MKVLVTGSAGFIGFHLVEKLVHEGCDIVGIDSINDYYETSLKFGRLKESGILKDEIRHNMPVQSKVHSNYRFFQVNLEDGESLSQLFEQEHFDVVVNLAAQAGVRYSIDNPHAYINSNVTGFVNILECSQKTKVKHVVYASSSSVYGLNSKEILSTSDSVDHPVSLYAATKRTNELLAHVYSNMYNLPVTGLRFFTVYGPWGRPDMAPMIFTKSILSGKPISVFNFGNMRRDFTYIDDIVDGIVRVMDVTPQSNREQSDLMTLPSTSTAPFVIYNIGNSSPVSLLDFITILENELGLEATKEFMPMQPGDVYSTYADVLPLEVKTGYRPNTSLQDGVKRFANWYKEYYGINKS